jgi:hypothetical protein
MFTAPKFVRDDLHLRVIRHGRVMLAGSSIRCLVFFNHCNGRPFFSYRSILVSHSFTLLYALQEHRLVETFFNILYAL